MSLNNSSTIVKAGFWYTICNFLSKGIAFLTVPLFTRFLSVGEIGMFSNYTTWLSCFCIIFTLELYSSVSIAYFDIKNEFNVYISTNLIAGTGITALFFILTAVFNKTFFEITQFSALEYYCLFLYLLFCPATQFFIKYSQIKNNYRSAVFATLFPSLISALISIILVVFLNNKYNARVIGYTIPLIITNIGLYLYFVSKVKEFNYRYFLYAFKLSMPIVFHSLAGIVLNSSDRIMIIKYLGSSQAGLYSIAVTCSMVVSILSGSLNSAYIPWLFNKLEQGDIKKIKMMVKPYLLFFGLTVLFFSLVAPDFLIIMGGEKYMPALYVIPPVVFGYLFQFIYTLYVNIEIYKKKQIWIAIGTIIAAMINIILNIIYIPKYGIIAAAYTSLIGFIVLLCIHSYIVDVVIKINCYPRRFIVFYIVSAFGIFLLLNLIFKCNILRYIVLASFTLCFLCIVVKYRMEMQIALKTKSIQPIIDIYLKKFKENL